MERMINYIEVKIEDFRISGKAPRYIAISESLLKQLMEKNIQLHRIVNLPVLCFNEGMLPEDGVYIHEWEKLNEV